MMPLPEFAEPLLTLMLFGFAYVLIIHWLVSHLRARGHGPSLDALADWMERVSLLVAPYVFLFFLHVMRALYNLPLLGSKIQRDNCDRLIAQVHRNTDSCK